MKIFQLEIPGAAVVETAPFLDQRGSFARHYCQHELNQIIGRRNIVQINASMTKTVGAVRGLHFQHPPKAEMKLVRCIKGRVWDVLVDLRRNSPTFKKWYAEELSPKNAKMMVIPEGCAHGFQVLSPDSEMLYLHTEFYSPEAGGRIRFDDPQLGVQWPLEVTELSEADREEPQLPADYKGLLL
jgi:dTDP-4-dehydrorhamnose 3,5-epimerase